MGSFQSGQMGQTVNLLVLAFGGSNPSLPTKLSDKRKVFFIYTTQILPLGGIKFRQYNNMYMPVTAREDGNVTLCIPVLPCFVPIKKLTLRFLIHRE